MKMLRCAFTTWLALLATACSAQTAPNGTSNEVSSSGMAGSDIGAKVNAAIAAMPASGGTVHIPAGDYSFATTIKLTRPGQHLTCDAGAALHYTGSGDAILLDPARG